MKLFTLIAAVAYVKAADNTAPKLLGVWDGQSSSACNTRVQFQVKSFVAFNTDITPGSCGDGTGTYVGTYALGPSNIFLNYIDYPLSLDFPDNILGDISFDGNDEFTLSYTLPGQPSGVVITFTRRSSDALDGVWFSPVQLTHAQLIAGTYVSFDQDENDPDELQEGFFGTYDIVSSTEMDITYVDVTIPNIEPGTKVTATYTKNSNTLRLVENSQLNFDITFQEDAATVLEGSWVGMHEGCQQTVQIFRSMYRAFRVGCESSGAYAGTISIEGSNMNISYGYTSDVNFPRGVTLPFTFSLTENDMKWTLNGNINDEPYTIVMDKVEAPPPFVAVKMILQGDVNTFNQTAFILDLATKLDIPPSAILVISVTAGSVIVEVGFVETPESTKTTSQILAEVDALTSVAGQSVSSVDTLAGSSAQLALPTTITMLILSGLALVMNNFF